MAPLDRLPLDAADRAVAAWAAAAVVGGAGALVGVGLVVGWMVRGFCWASGVCG